MMPTSLGNSDTQEAGGTPYVDPGASVVNPCSDCGGCSFSSGSSLEVVVSQGYCGPGLLFSVNTKTLPFHSANATRVRYELDADNWAEYVCAKNMWSYGLEDWGTAGSTGTCISTSGSIETLQVDKCTGFEVREKINGIWYDVIVAVRKNNNCIPLTAA